jgi:hypothetical protein
MTTSSVLNGAVEVGLRALVLLVEASPNALDLQQLVTLDYFLVHSGDVDGGPDSLHAPSPLRSGEVTIRRELLTKGLNLYELHGLVAQMPSAKGFAYTAEEGAGSFLDAFRSAYVENLRTRAEWVIERFGLLEYGDLHHTLETSLSMWKREFADVLPMEDDE